MGNLKSKFKVLLFGAPAVCGAVFLTACGDGLDVNGMVRERIESRRGSPEIFYLNGVPYSASKFRRELYFERRQIRNKFDPPAPTELRDGLRSYIEETILLRAAGEIDLNSAEAREYMWPFLRRAVIAYYLEKKSGSFDLNKNYSDIKIPPGLIEKFYESRKARFKKEKISEAELKRRLSRTAVRLKWRKLHNAARARKKGIIGDLKKNNKVRLIPRETYKLPGDSK